MTRTGWEWVGGWVEVLPYLEGSNSWVTTEVVLTSSSFFSSSSRAGRAGEEEEEEEEEGVPMYFVSRAEMVGLRSKEVPA